MLASAAELRSSGASSRARVLGGAVPRPDGEPPSLAPTREMASPGVRDLAPEGTHARRASRSRPSSTRRRGGARAAPARLATLREHGWRRSDGSSQAADDAPRGASRRSCSRRVLNASDAARHAPGRKGACLCVGRSATRSAPQAGAQASCCAYRDRTRLLDLVGFCWMALIVGRALPTRRARRSPRADPRGCDGAPPRTTATQTSSPPSTSPTRSRSSCRSTTSRSARSSRSTATSTRCGGIGARSRGRSPSSSSTAPRPW